jgi:hypothetical protein
MIYPLNMLVQAPEQSSKANAASAAKLHARPDAAPSPLQPEAPASQSTLPDWSSRALAEQPAPSINPLTAILSPIGEADQAAAATQHARRLILAQPSTAMRVQANSNSQSVERLLQ